jgi:hypothetical protein
MRVPFLFVAGLVPAWLALAADSTLSGFEALDASAAANLARGMTHQVYGPMLQETEETAYSNDPILPTKLTVSITKPLPGCENSTEARCKTSTAYVETSNVDAPQFGYRTKPGFGWSIEDVFEYPKGKLPHCILVELREEMRSGKRDAAGAWPMQQLANCVTDAGPLETAAFDGDVLPLSDAESAISREAPATLTKQTGAPWSIGFINSGTRAKGCKESNAIPECRSFLVGLVSDGQGHDFAFRSPTGFAVKQVSLKTTFNANKTPRCLDITFEEQLRSGDKSDAPWPTRQFSVCVSPEGFNSAR